MLLIKTINIVISNLIKLKKIDNNINKSNNNII